MPLNPAMLIWMALAGAPVVIHLINRRRYRVLHWGAMQFLEESVAKSSRRMQLEHLLLLLVRILIVAFIVYAMARPFLPGGIPAIPGGRPRRNVVIVLDSSLSMRYDELRVSTFARAREATAEILNLLDDGDSVNVVLATGKPRVLVPEPIVDHARLQHLLQSIEPGGGESNMPAAFELALAQLDKSHNPQREIYVVTDGQGHGWHAESHSHWFTALALRVRAQEPPAVHIVTLGDDHRENAAVVGLSTAHSTIGIHHPARFDVRVRNFGRTDRNRVTIYFEVEDTAPQQTTLDLPAGESVTIPFHHQFTNPGSYVVRARIEPDMFPVDDRIQTAVDVHDSIPVLLIDGSPVKPTLSPLELALQPRDRALTERRTLLAVDSRRPNDIPPFSIQNYHLIVLHNVGRLNHAQISALERFVTAGGGLLIFPGDNTEIAQWNTMLHRDGEGLLPAALAIDTKTRATGRAEPFTHSALRAFRDPAYGDFGRIEADKHFTLTVSPRDRSARVIARLDNGNPLLVEKQYGRGRVVLAALPVDEAWTNLQKRPLFVPLMHYMAWYLAGTVQPPLNVPIGSALSRFIQNDVDTENMIVRTPDGHEYSAQATTRGERIVATFTDTEKPGVYRMSGGGDTQPVHFVVRSPAEESNLAPLEAGERVWLEENIGAVFVEGMDDLRTRMFLRPRGLREYWQLMVGLAIALTLAEPLLSGRFSRHTGR